MFVELGGFARTLSGCPRLHGQVPKGNTFSQKQDSLPHFYFPHSSKARKSVGPWGAWKEGVQVEAKVPDRTWPLPCP